VTEVSEGIELALEQFEAAVELECSLDVRNRGSLNDVDAVGVASNATDGYMASCGSLMKVIPKVQARKDVKLERMLKSNITFMMGRIEELQVLLQRRGSASKHISFTSEQLMLQRERARISQKTDSNENKRTMVAREILATEKSYIASLKKLLDFYVLPLTTGNIPIVEQSEKMQMFGNIEEIMGLAQSFYAALQKKLSVWGPNSTMGDTFKTHAMFFKIYVIYTNAYREGISAVQKLFAENEDAARVVKKAQVAGCPDISSLMINPIQRLPRYVLLLKELRKRTSDDHPDARLLEGALADIQVVADHVNETLRQHEDNAKILEIQSALWTTRLGGVPVTLLAPGRSFVKEGKLLKVRSIGTTREVHLFLFSDMLLYCTSSRILPGRYHYHNHLEFYGASAGVDEAVRLGCTSVLRKYAFKVTSAQIVRVFLPESEEERDMWINIINECASKKMDLDARRSSKRLSSSSIQSLRQ